MAALEVYDHDYPHLAEGKVVPHGIYDLQRNEGYITIGTSHETASFITDNLEWWWLNSDIQQYPNAKNILIFCDAGGGNCYRHHIFKKKLLELADKIGKTLTIHLILLNGIQLNTAYLHTYTWLCKG